MLRFIENPQKAPAIQTGMNSSLHILSFRLLIFKNFVFIKKKVSTSSAQAEWREPVKGVLKAMVKVSITIIISSVVFS
jgi:hypothetical protein